MTNQFPFLSRLRIRPLSAASLLGALLPFSLLVCLIWTKEPQFQSWMFYPLSIIPLGGAFGGAFFYLMGFHWFPKGRQKLIAVIFSTLAYGVALWLSAVIAFNFTGHWN